MFKIKKEVKEALHEGKPIVALESTLISHGLPYPQNVELALELEKLVKKHGAIPATIGVINGKITVGLNEEEIELLARERKKVLKLSAKDIPYAVVKKKNGATTVAATMKIAAMQKIYFFATGGIGGVHRGVEKTWDISADLLEFQHSPVMVISAGAKAILDLPKTLEFLETAGILVVGYQTDEFPAFYSRSSGLKIGFKVDSPEEAAKLFSTQQKIAPQKGLLLVNPIPEDKEIPAEKIGPFIEEAVVEATEKGITGKEVTPFLLQKLVELTKSKSLEANLALIKNNVIVASKIAAAYNKIT